MKVVQINCLFKSGSTGKIVAVLYDYVKAQGDDAYVIYGIGEKQDDDHLIRTTPWVVRKAQSFRSRITGYPYGGCIWGTATALSALRRIKPDVVHLQCANGYMVNIYRILEYLKENHIPTVITNHAEFMYTGGCTHTVDCNKWLTGCHDCSKISKEHPISYFFDRTENEWKMLQKAYKGFEKLTICCVSDWVRERAAQSPFFKSYPIVTVLNGVDTDAFHYTDSSSLREKLGLARKKIVIHITPNFYSIIKGGQHVLEMANRFPDVEFVIVGSDAKDENTPGNCHFVGKITEQSLLAQYYSMGDVCLLTSIRETFSMVCAESLCCGTPIVGFKSGGPELIALPDYSAFVEQGDDDALESALSAMLGKMVVKTDISDRAVDTYGKKTMCDNYYRVYQELLK